MEDFIAENIKSGNDLIVNFWWKPINGKEYGHYVLISEFDTKKKIVTVCDPSHTSRSFWSVELDKLKGSMSSEWTFTERGFVIIKKQ